MCSRVKSRVLADKLAGIEVPLSEMEAVRGIKVMPIRFAESEMTRWVSAALIGA